MSLPLDEIILGDCLDVISKLPDACVDLIITDPPFKVSQKYGGGVDADNLMAVSSILKLFPELSRVLKPNRFAAIFYDNRILPFLFEAIKGTDFVYRKQLFLYRRWGNAHRWCGWMQCTDPICIFVNGYNDKPFSPKVKGKVKHDCYVKSGPEEIGTNHPAQKPIEIIKDIIMWFSDEGDVVLDPYCGSGTVPVACVSLNRHYIAMDNNVDYCRGAQQRIRGIIPSAGGNEETFIDMINGHA